MTRHMHGITNKTNSLHYQKINNDLELISIKMISCMSSSSLVLLTGFSPVCVSVSGCLLSLLSLSLHHHCSLSQTHFFPSFLLSHKPGEKTAERIVPCSSTVSRRLQELDVLTVTPSTACELHARKHKDMYLKLALLQEKAAYIYVCV